MKKQLFLYAVFFCSCILQAQPRKVFTTTPVYDSIIAGYQAFDKQYTDDTLLSYGKTDIGKPLNLYVLSPTHNFDPQQLKKQGKAILFVNNGIHPGEPDGIDACIELVKTYHKNPKLFPDNLVLIIVPVYNIDGCLNRSCCSRANQNGPEEYGFRGNAKNLDLNRDFIKADAGNTIAIETIFRDWDPDVFIDTHVSDGADYQYTMTLIATQRSKLNPVLEPYLSQSLTPALYAAMKIKKQEMIPYVETYGRTPETGITEFLETPRFSTGYAALRNTLGFVSETHMWKPYNDRVWATYDLLQTLIDQLKKDGSKIIALRAEAFAADQKMKFLKMNWEMDTTKFDLIDFKGYAAMYKTSPITGLQQLWYNRKAPYTQKIRFYHTYTASDSVSLPKAYVVPQAWTDVIDRLKLNVSGMRQLTADTTIRGEIYYIDKCESPKSPYESHFLHSNIKVRRDTQQLKFYKGDYLIPVSTARNVRYLAETLEPISGDGFFAWNFFDGILNQKEWFSDYIFEAKAEELLKNDPKLKAGFDAKRAADKSFATDQWGQLNYIYQHSEYKEKTHNRYPVMRVF